MTADLTSIKAREKKFAPWADSASLARLQELRAAPQADFFRAYGFTVIGPVIGFFVAWMLGQAKGKPLWLLMREGKLLAEIAAIIAPESAARSLWISRSVAMQAAIDAAHYEEGLRNILQRARTHAVTLREALRQLGVTENEAPDLRIDEKSIDEAMAWLGRERIRAAVLDKTGALRARLLAYLERGGLRQDESVLLGDLGYAGNIQRCLQQVLRARQAAAQTHGFYLVTSAGIRWAEQAGCVTRGFLGDHGAPEDFVAAATRTPELMELCTTSQDGSLLDFDAQGAPVCEPRPYPEKQWAQMQAVQDGARDFARAAKDELNKFAQAPGEDLPGFLRAIWMRALLDPTEEEARNLGAWIYDANLGGQGPVRSLAAVPAYTVINAEVIAGARRDALYWPAAAALTRKIDPAALVPLPAR